MYQSALKVDPGEMDFRVHSTSPKVFLLYFARKRTFVDTEMTANYENY